MLEFLEKILNIDSTSGNENALALYFKENYHPPGAELELQETNNKRLNLFYKWGQPRVIFCTHFDTVPPYIPPRFEKDIIYGRGSCDAKGQIAYMYEAACRLYNEGADNFGLLLLAGEEDGSHGAKRANELIRGCEFVIIGEPTNNKLIKASKGTLLAKVSFSGESCHSGYSHCGDNAIDRMLTFFDRLSRVRFLYDEVLGETTYNLGQLHSHNAHNVVSDNASVNIFFRTTHKSHDLISNILRGLADEKTEIEFSSNDRPLDFLTLPGFETGIVSYGTDAPSLTNLGERLLYGPGSILNAHTQCEHILIKDLFRAVDDIKDIYHILSAKKMAANY